ncbi:MAG: histidine phosphatase family protein [Acidimicrobiia bacterium]|nr:histidine phosphatase family protein [Acidimicrobiia bacterium]
MQLTLIRHGQSEANAARLWQGEGDAPLTDRGRRQAKALGSRLDLGSFDRVFSSTLVRARTTAGLAGFEAEARQDLGEMRLGEWEGLTFDEVSERFPDELAALRAGEEIRWGRTGETFEEFNGRVTAELARILAHADPRDRILIVAHGGTNNTILRSFLPTDQMMFRVFGAPTNTSITEVTIDTEGAATIERYNDAAHLGPLSDWAEERRSEGAAVVDLVRHGVTQANLERRVQGQADWGLHADGEDQARRLSSWIGHADRVYSSSSGRAARTAQLVFPVSDVVHDDGLMEVAMGEWQGEKWEEVVRQFPDEIAALRSGSSDVARGVSGETFADVQGRVASTIASIAAKHKGDRVGVISHGLAIRAYLASVVNLDHTNYRTFGRLGNTAFSRVVVTADGPLIAEYNLQYHLLH